MVLVYADGLDDALSDFGRPSVGNTETGLIAALLALANEAGLDDTQLDAAIEFVRPFWAKKKEYYIAEPSDTEQAESIVSSMNTFFRQLSTHVSEKRVENLRRQPAVIAAVEQLQSPGEEIADALPPPNIGSFDFVAAMASVSSITKASDAKTAFKDKVRIESNSVPDSVSLTLFCRPREGEAPSHVLTFRSNKEKSKRELVGGGKWSLVLGTSFIDHARRKLYEETFGLISSLPGGLPPEPTLVWEGNAMGGWYAKNYAMVVTDDEDGKVLKSLADTLNAVSGQLEKPFKADALSTIHPTLKDYQWTSVDAFESSCRINLKKSWHQLLQKIVREDRNSILE